MNTIIPIAKALSDESRVRATLMLRGGELCVCQIVEALKLAPATVSKHMSILHDAGIVERQKRGKWAYYQLAGRRAAPVVREAMKWLFNHLKADEQIRRDMKTLCCVRAADPSELTGCYGGVSSTAGSSRGLSRASKVTGGPGNRKRPAK